MRDSNITSQLTLQGLSLNLHFFKSSLLLPTQLQCRQSIPVVGFDICNCIHKFNSAKAVAHNFHRFIDSYTVIGNFKGYLAYLGIYITEYHMFPTPHLNIWNGSFRARVYITLFRRIQCPTASMSNFSRKKINCFCSVFLDNICFISHNINMSYIPIHKRRGTIQYIHNHVKTHIFYVKRPLNLVRQLYWAILSHPWYNVAIKVTQSYIL